MPSPLENLCGPGKPLHAEPPDAREFAGLQRSGLSRLKDAQLAQLSLESRFDLAYNAAHAMCPGGASLARLSVRQSLHRLSGVPHTLERGPEVWRVLNKGHEIRNLGEYEGDLNIDERIVRDLIGACKQVAAKLSALPPLP